MRLYYSRGVMVLLLQPLAMALALTSLANGANANNASAG